MELRSCRAPRYVMKFENQMQQMVQNLVIGSISIQAPTETALLSDIIWSLTNITQMEEHTLC